MANPILDALSGLLDVADMPGSYTRGLLAGRPGERLSGTELLNHYNIDPGEGVGGFLANMGTSILTDPLTYAIPVATALAGRLGRGVANAGKLSVAESMPFRRITRVFKEDPSGAMRQVGGSKAASSINLANAETLAKTRTPTHFGSFYPEANASVIFNTPQARETMRHELTHALIKGAARTGEMKGMPLGWQMTARMQRSNNPLLNALGEIGDEMAAYGSDRMGSWNFLKQADPAYVSQFTKASPLAGAIYEGRYIPRAAAGAAGLAGAGLAGLLGSQLGVGQ